MLPLNNISELKERRRELRNNGTREEAVLWMQLRNKNLGVKFRRQHSIGGYIVDFYCPKQNLIIEIDGSQHFKTQDQKYDENRTRYLESMSKKVLRFNNEEITSSLTKVLEKIRNEIKK